MAALVLTGAAIQCVQLTLVSDVSKRRGAGREAMLGLVVMRADAVPRNWSLRFAGRCNPRSCLGPCARSAAVAWRPLASERPMSTTHTSPIAIVCMFSRHHSVSVSISPEQKWLTTTNSLHVKLTTYSTTCELIAHDEKSLQVSPDAHPTTASQHSSPGRTPKSKHPRPPLPRPRY